VAGLYRLVSDRFSHICEGEPRSPPRDLYVHRRRDRAPPLNSALGTYTGPITRTGRGSCLSLSLSLGCTRREARCRDSPGISQKLLALASLRVCCRRCTCDSPKADRDNAILLFAPSCCRLVAGKLRYSACHPRITTLQPSDFSLGSRVILLPRLQMRHEALPIANHLR
jgi:hypothetical protein